MVEPARTPVLPVAVLMVPFALATWAVDRVDGAVGTLVLGWTVLVVAGAGIGTVLQSRTPPPPRPRTTGAVVAVVAAWLTLTWYVVGWGAGADLGPVAAAVGSLVTAQLGGALGCWLVSAHRAPRPSWTPAVVLALAPTLLFWLAWSAGDRPEIEAMSDDLESTGVPPFRVQVAGYDLERVYPGTNNLYAGPGITYWLRPQDDAVRDILIVVVASDDTDLCPASPDCLSLYEPVELADAVALVRRPDSPDDVVGDFEDVVSDIGDAGLVTYDELGRLHPPADDD